MMSSRRAGFAAALCMVATAALAVAGCGDQPAQEAQAQATPVPQAAPAAPAQPVAEPVAHPASVPSAQDAPDTTRPVDVKDSELPPFPVTPYPWSRPREVVESIFKFAARHPEVLSKVPCFCGCERMGHRGNDDCFVKARDARGRPTQWEEHGVG
jgi:hypothetical protein